MKILCTSAGVVLAILGSLAGVAGGHEHRSQAQTVLIRSAVRTRSTRKPAAAAFVSVRLAEPGRNLVSARGPYRVRPTRIAFDFGSYYGAGSKGVWIDHLRWFDWGKPIAYASGVVHARLWPSHRFITTAGGIMLDQLQACGTKYRFYYRYASMLAPGGFPQNTSSIAYGESEQALAPC
jgi:hypothetical protein